MSLLPALAAITAAREARDAMDAIYEKVRGFDGRIDWQAARAAEKFVIAQLEAAGFRVTSKSDTTAIAIAGFRASSTTGLSGALSNWLLRAEAAG